MHTMVLVIFLNDLCNGCEKFSQVGEISSVGGAVEFLELSLFHSKIALTSPDVCAEFG